NRVPRRKGMLRTQLHASGCCSFHGGADDVERPSRDHRKVGTEGYLDAKPAEEADRNAVRRALQTECRYVAVTEAVDVRLQGRYDAKISDPARHALVGVHTVLDAVP